MKQINNDIRIENEIEHGKYLIQQGAGDVWNWESPAGKVRWERRVEMLTKTIGPEMYVLEIGCGTGYFTKEIVKTRAKIVAIDISEDLIHIAKQEITENNVEFKIENAYAMSFPNETFDIVLGSSVLHHLEIDAAISEMFRVLKPRGSIFFTEPNMMNPQIALQKNIPYLKRKMGDSPDETAFFRWSIKSKLKKAGFKSVTITPFDFLHPQIPKSLIAPIQWIGNIFEKISLCKEIAGSLYITAKK